MATGCGRSPEDGSDYEAKKGERDSQGPQKQIFEAKWSLGKKMEFTVAKMRICDLWIQVLSWPVNSWIQSTYHL